MNDIDTLVGMVAGLWRYPVKSMLGEELAAVEVTARGLEGDRAYALVDSSDGRVATAKNPRKWPQMFACRTSFVGPPQGADLGALRITLPDGTTISGNDTDINRVLSQAMTRDVTLESAANGNSDGAASSEAYWPDMEEIPPEVRDNVTEWELPEGTFFDAAVVNILTSSTLQRLGELYPDGKIETSRFRPNIVIEITGDLDGFAEDAWIGCSLDIGEELRLAVIKACSRCIMTTLPQGNLPSDLEILRTAVKHHDANIGVYASVIRGGMIRCGDSVRMGS